MERGGGRVILERTNPYRLAHDKNHSMMWWGVGGRVFVAFTADELEPTPVSVCTVSEIQPDMVGGG